MKGRALKIVVTALLLSLISGITSYGETKKEMKYTPLTETGIPVVVTTRRITGRTLTVYSGSKRIPAGFQTPGVVIRAQSSNEGISVRVGGNVLFFENRGLTPGNSSTITVTASHADYEPVVQEIKVTVTDGNMCPHIIATKEDLLLIPSLGLNRRYRQAADIDLDGINEWAPIGDRNRPFTGVYDGDSFKIKNMRFREIDSEYPGLFGVVSGESAQIIDINLDGRISDALYPVGRHGTIAGLLDGGTISGCSFTGDMTLGKGRMLAGGITSEVVGAGRIINCSYSGKISSQNGNDTSIGGIAGNTTGIIEGCTVSGQIVNESERANVGGVVGINFGTIKETRVASEISRYGVDGILGGIVGRNDGLVQDSAFQGKLYSKGNGNIAGGAAAFNRGRIAGSAIKGRVSFNGDKVFAGGVAGRNQGAISNTTAEAEITGIGFGCYAGGLAGENYSFIDRSNVGRVNSSVASIEKSSFNGDIKLEGDLGVAGGAAGRNFGLTAITGGVENNAKSIIKDVAVRAGSIDAKKAGRITSESTLASVGAKADAVHPVLLENNAAFDKLLINGKAVDSGAVENGISMGSAELEDFITECNIRPPAVALFIK